MRKPRKELSEKQKEVLRTNQFTTDTARECGARGGYKKKENEPKRKAHEEVKKQIIEETYGQIYDRLIEGKLSNGELLNLFGNTIKISGDLIQKQEVELPQGLTISVYTDEE